MFQQKFKWFLFILTKKKKKGLKNQSTKISFSRSAESGEIHSGLIWGVI